MKTPIEKLLEIITLKEKENAIYLMPIIDKIDIDKLISEEKQLLIHSVSSTLDLEKMDKKFDELLKEWDAEKLQKWIDSKG